MDELKLPKARGNACADEAPLTIPELYALWIALPDSRRWSFVLALEEQIADQLIEYCWRRVVRAENGI